jgi:hypothetical protein
VPGSLAKICKAILTLLAVQERPRSFLGAILRGVRPVHPEAGDQKMGFVMFVRSDLLTLVY